MIDLILKNGFVITMDKKNPTIEDGAVAIDKGRIVGIGKTKEILEKFSATETIDCEDHAIMPGFVDAHGHAGHSVLKAVVNNTKYWMPAMTHTYKHYINDDFWYYEGRQSALERLKLGVTTGVCVMGSQPRCDDPIHAINNAKAYAELGVKDVVVTGPCNVPWPHNFSRWVNGKRIMRAVSFEDCVESMETVIKTLNNTNNGKTHAFVGPFGMVTSINPSGETPLNTLTNLTEHDKRQAKEMLRVSKEYDTRIHTDAFGGMVMLAKQDLKNAVLGPKVHLQHCSSLSEEEVQILADTGTHASAAGGSRAPVHIMLRKGVNIVATTDGSMHGVGFDMFKCMQRFQQNSRIIADDPTLLPCEKMLEMVTIDAAKAMGMENEIGSIEIGKKADIITANLMHPRLMPKFNIVYSLVMNGNGSDIDNVIIDGEILVRDNKVLKADEKAIMKRAAQEVEVVVKRAGLDKFAYQDTIFWGKSNIELEERYDFEWQKQDGGHYMVDHTK